MNTNKLLGQDEYNLLMGAKPYAPILNPITLAQKSEIFQWVVEENIEYKYINGSCEDRAHYICMLLKSKGVATGKIWNFAPARYTFLSNELFNIEDPFGISGSITWGYHVAPYLLAYDENGNEEIVVIDQCFDAEKYIPKYKWLSLMQCPQAIHLLTDMDSYLFNSIFSDGGAIPFSYETHYHTPLDEPSIITGNFWMLFPEDDYVQKGMAINELAVEISQWSKTASQPEADFLRYTLQSIDAVIALINSPKPQVLTDHTFSHLLNFYFARYNHWSIRIEALKLNTWV